LQGAVVIGTSQSAQMKSPKQEIKIKRKRFIRRCCLCEGYIVLEIDDFAALIE
jgi:hypothetical protein